MRAIKSSCLTAHTLRRQSPVLLSLVHSHNIKMTCGNQYKIFIFFKPQNSPRLVSHEHFSPQSSPTRNKDNFHPAGAPRTPGSHKSTPPSSPFRVPPWPLCWHGQKQCVRPHHPLWTEAQIRVLASGGGSVNDLVINGGDRKAFFSKKRVPFTYKVGEK